MAPLAAAALALALVLRPLPGLQEETAGTPWPTSMEELAATAQQPSDVAGLVVGAPHEGHDLRTEDLARAIGQDVGCKVVVARNYRKKSAGRYINVNRPTERAVHADGSLGPDTETERARRAFDQWCALTGADQAPIPLYVEVHGFSRTVPTPGGDVELDVVELATVGIDAPTAQQLKAAWDPLVSTLGLPPLYVDVVDSSYTFHGTQQPFHFRASEARANGTLQDTHVVRALHFELPVSVRSDNETRQAVATAIAALIDVLQPAAVTSR